MADFDFKEKFPISDYINGIIKKRQIEEKARQNGRQAIIQGLSSISDVANQYAERKAQNESDLARAAILAKTNPELMGSFDKQIGTRTDEQPLPTGVQGPLPEPTQKPIKLSDTMSGRQQVIQSMANALRGVSGDTFLKELSPDYIINSVTPYNVATGERGETITQKVPKGSKTTMIPFGSRPNMPTASLRESQYVDEDGTPLTFVPSTGQRIRPDGTVAKKPVLRKGDESSVQDATLIANQLPQVDVLFDAYKNKNKLGKSAQATPLGYVLDPATKQAENSLKLAAFTFGGKNLTGQEKEVVFGALFPNPFDNDAAREKKRTLLKNFFTGKIDLLEAANQLGPSAKPLRDLLIRIQKQSDSSRGISTGGLTPQEAAELAQLERKHGGRK
jgi:hypothetical protein